jgi:hypothetical protein
MPAAVSTPPTVLDRSFLVFQPDATAERAGLTVSDVLKLLQAHRDLRWFVVQSAARATPGHFVYGRDSLEETIRERIDRGSGQEPFSGLLLQKNPSPVIDPLAFRKSTKLCALVVDDGVLLGVTVARHDVKREGLLRATGDLAMGVFKHLVDGIVSPAVQHAGPTGFRGGAAHPPAERPHCLSASMPSEVIVGKTVALTISLVREAVASRGSLQMVDGEALELVAQGDAGLEVVGENIKDLTAGEAGDDAFFAFKGMASGTSRVRVVAFQRGYSVARLAFEVKVVMDYGQTPADAVPVGDAPLSQAPPATSTATSPDLRLMVLEVQGGVCFELWAAGTRVERYPRVAIADLDDYARRFSDAIDGLKIGTPEAAAISREKIGAWGVDLFKNLIPPALQTLLWQQPDAVTVQVCSDESWIPWEACRLVRFDADGRVEEGGFFAERFAMTRWLYGAPPPRRLRMTRCALVVPESSGLETAAAERAFFEGLKGERRVIDSITARYLPLTVAMKSGVYDAWHFCGHASAGALRDGDGATLRLEGNEAMRADLFAGAVENALVPSPLIFFNACESAQGGRSPGATGVGGWAHRFIRPNADRHGAAAFIGTYWSVYEHSAHAFALALYRGLDSGQAIGVAARDARRAAMRRDAEGVAADPLSWLAYTVYADPLATLEKP